MKIRTAYLLILLSVGVCKLSAQVTCTSEKGYSDFPFTLNGLTVTASGTGGYTSYGTAYTSCSVSTKAPEVYIGQSASTFTNTFSAPVNDMVYNITAAGDGEVVTITVNSGTPTVTYIAGDCPEAMILSGNVITMAAGTDNHGGRVKVHSTSNFTSVTFSHNGASAGLLMTMCFDAVFESVKPTVTTAAISSITGSSASGGGDVTADGGASVTEKGVCWNTATEPTIGNSHSSDGTGTGAFTSSITSLATGTTYHVRAYATNSNGTAYGSEVDFLTSSAATPQITTSVTSLSAFSTCTGSASTAQTFTASGADLSENITITAPAGYQVATMPDLVYGTTVTLTQSGGSVSTTTIYVKLTSAVYDVHSGDVSCTSPDATTKNIAVTGTVYRLSAGGTVKW